jgi:hypothetical protein
MEHETTALSPLIPFPRPLMVQKKTLISAKLNHLFLPRLLPLRLGKARAILTSLDPRA